MTSSKFAMSLRDSFERSISRMSRRGDSCMATSGTLRVGRYPRGSRGVEVRR